MFRLNDPVIQQIVAYARNSAAAKIGYVNGMAVAFGRVHTNLCRNESAAMDMAQADAGEPQTDAIAHFSAEFSKLGMDNSDGGVHLVAAWAVRGCASEQACHAS